MLMHISLVSLCLQDNFSHMGFALVKSVVMMIGEYDFDSLFFDLEADYIVPYPTFTLLFFLGTDHM